MVLIDKNSEKNVLSNSEIIDRFTNYMTSVYGGRLCDKHTAPEYTQMIRTIIKSLSNDKDDFATLCSRYNIRDRLIAQQCVMTSYAPKTIKKYLTALQHF